MSLYLLLTPLHDLSAPFWAFRRPFQWVYPIHNTTGIVGVMRAATTAAKSVACSYTLSRWLCNPIVLVVLFIYFYLLTLWQSAFTIYFKLLLWSRHFMLHRALLLLSLVNYRIDFLLSRTRRRVSAMVHYLSFVITYLFLFSWLKNHSCALYLEIRKPPSSPYRCNQRKVRLIKSFSEDVGS